MRPLHARFLEEIAAEQERTRSRRSFVGSGAKLAAGGAFGFALAGTASLSSAPSILAQDFSGDVDILNYALTLEHLEHAFYRDGLEALGQADIANAAANDEAFSLLNAIRDHEQAHVDALTQVINDLAGEPVAEATYDFGYEDAAGFLEVAMALENTGVAAYAGAAPSISDETILTAALGIHSVEARHAAFLNSLNMASPFPQAVDMPLSRDEALAIAGDFIVDEDTSGSQGGESAVSGESAQIGIDMFRFLPGSIEVAVGTTVTWTNLEIIPHTVTADDGSFDSGMMELDDTFSYTFDQAGSFSYFCEYHDNMTGVVMVG